MEVSSLYFPSMLVALNETAIVIVAVTIGESLSQGNDILSALKCSMVRIS